MHSGKPKIKKINPYIQALMDRDGYKTINEAARGWGIPQSTLDSLADTDRKHSIFLSILENAKKLGVGPEELMQGVLHGKEEDALAG